MNHRGRAKEILKRHPEIRNLQAPDRTGAPIALSAASLHLALALYASKLSTPMWFCAAYLLGAGFAQFGFLAVHELAHDLFFASSLSNKLFSILVNLPLVFPFAIVFRKYHLLHHIHQGAELDFDLPSEFEIKTFRGTFGKFVWLSFQLVFYALRPCFQFPIKPCRYAAINAAVQVIFNAFLMFFFGPDPIKFLLASLFFAGGLHPCSGHFLSEHVQFDPNVGEQDTFSYYGVLNIFVWNCGHHVEHHDFPRVPGRRLPQLHEMAKESYEGLVICESWPKSLVRFVFDQKLDLGRCRARR